MVVRNGAGKSGLDWLPSLGAVVAGLCVSLSAIAQPAGPSAPPPPGSLNELVADLSSQDYERRSSAQENIRRHPDATLSSLETLLETPGLDPEQRVVLGGLARERFGIEPRAALGISYNNAWMVDRRNSPALIQATFPGFDSARALVPGDAVLSFDGSRITDQTSFRSHILSYNPGEFTRLQVERDDKIIEVDVQMGSQDQLRAQQDPPNANAGFGGGGINPITTSALDEAWTVRVLRQHLDVGVNDTVLDSELSPVAWRDTWESTPGAADPRRAQAQVAITAGGKARGGPPEAMREFVGGEFRAGARFGRNWTNRDQNVFTVAQLESVNRDIEIRIADLRRRLEGLNPDQLAQKVTELNELGRLTAIRDRNARTIAEMNARQGGRNQPRR